MGQNLTFRCDNCIHRAPECGCRLWFSNINNRTVLSKAFHLHMGITKTHSRPYTSDDNPFSEAQFKTLKYRPDFPDRFGSIEDARQFCRTFFAWYNNEHKHTGISLLSPTVVHHGNADTVIAIRQTALDKAYSLHPERFVRKMPKHKPMPEAVWINPPKPATS
jgi:putative transposase